jgi:AcrR family transcriptional regulator
MLIKTHVSITTGCDEMPKIVNHEEKKLEIATMAIDVFSEKGYYNTNLVDVAEKCNLGRTTLYQYFKNKDEIYYYILELGISFYWMQYDLNNNNHDLSYLEKIIEQVNFLIMNINGQSVSQAFLDFWLMVRHNHSDIEGKMVEHYNAIIDSLASWLNKSIQNNEIIQVDANATAVVLVGMIEAISLQELSKRNLKPETAYHSVVQLINGLKVC